MVGALLSLSSLALLLSTIPSTTTFTLRQQLQRLQRIDDTAQRLHRHFQQHHQRVVSDDVTADQPQRQLQHRQRVDDDTAEKQLLQRAAQGGFDGDYRVDIVSGTADSKQSPSSSSSSSSSLSSLPAGLPFASALPNVTKACANALERIGAEKMARMLDASGRPIPGLLEGAIAWIGDFDECLRWVRDV